MSGSPLGNSGAQIERMFSAQDFLRTLHDERALLDVVLAPTDGRIDQTLKYREGGWRVDAMRRRVIQGFRRFSGSFTLEKPRKRQTPKAQLVPVSSHRFEKPTR